ncbi:MAG: M23 family metallopeptidase [Oscillospiraceae bacterium]
MYQKHWKFPHYGIDMGCDEKGYDTYALGAGKVIACGLNNGAIDKGLGNCIIIRYDDVEQSNGTLQSLVCQMFHFDKILVEVGQTVTNKTIIGHYGKTGKNYHIDKGCHLHLQFSTDVANPNSCAGIAPQSNGRVVTSVAVDNTIDPSAVWFKNNGQSIRGLTSNWFTAKDINLKSIGAKSELKPEYQYLVQPVNNMIITCSYKNKPYETKFRLGTHYGTDFCGSRQIWGSGDGEIISTGYDNCFGNFVVAKYYNAVNHSTNKYRDIIFRYYHMSSCAVKVGQKITKDTKLGIMGNTGTYSQGIHCHLECDSDTKYYNYTPTLRGATSHFRAGNRVNDTTLNVMNYLNCKFTAPDNQKISRTQDIYTDENDINIPKIK